MTKKQEKENANEVIKSFMETIKNETTKNVSNGGHNPTVYGLTREGEVLFVAMKNIPKDKNDKIEFLDSISKKLFSSSDSIIAFGFTSHMNVTIKNEKREVILVDVMDCEGNSNINIISVNRISPDKILGFSDSDEDLKDFNSYGWHKINDKKCPINNSNVLELIIAAYINTIRNSIKEEE